jgi:hypothetical protein
MALFRLRWEDVKWGVGRGVRFALFVSFFAVLLRIIGGSAAYLDMEISFQSTIMATVSAGIICGIIAGVFRPATSTINGSAVLGLALGALSGCIFYLSGLRNLSPMQVVGFIVGYAIMGLLIGIRTRQKVTQRIARVS